MVARLLIKSQENQRQFSWNKTWMRALSVCNERFVHFNSDISHNEGFANGSVSRVHQCNKSICYSKPTRWLLCLSTRYSFAVQRTAFAYRRWCLNQSVEGVSLIENSFQIGQFKYKILGLLFVRLFYGYTVYTKVGIQKCIIWSLCFRVINTNNIREKLI